jgi:acetyl esterase
LPKTFDWDKDKIDEALDAKLRDASPVTHLTKDDPPALAINQNVQNIHSPNMAIYLKQRMDALGIECERHMESEFSSKADRAHAILEFIEKQFKNHPLP